MRQRHPEIRHFLRVALILAACLACSGIGSAPGAPAPGCGGPTVSRIDGWIDENRAALQRGALVLGSREMTDDELRALLADRRMTQLQTLTIHDNRLTADAVRAVASSPRTRGLTTLQLTRNQLGDEGLRALAGWSGAASLQALYLGANGASATGVGALARSEHLGRLEILELSHQPIGDTSAAALVKLSAGKLHVEHAGLTGVGATRLIGGAASPRLFLDGNPVGPGGLKGLRAIAPTVSTLSLADCGLDATDARALAAVDAPALKLLVLTKNKLGDAGLDAIAKARWLPGLQALQITYAGGSPQARARLRAAWGDRPGLVMER